AGMQNFGRSRETLALLDRARLKQDVAIDAYPYAAAATVLHPDYIHDATRTIVAWSGAVPAAAGRDLAELAAEWHCSLDEASDRLQPASAIYFMMDEADVRRILSDPHTMIGSDGLQHDPHPHPRLWGAFARVLGHYARDVGLFTLEEAVRRMTGLPASRFGFVDRGQLRPGAFADLVLFDPDRILDKSTFEKPVQACAGIDLVVVNGQIVFRDGTHTGARPGRVLTGAAAA
ncbi:MAG: amidohydrolase family protein, partial [Dongiaceae bacterium]